MATPEPDPTVPKTLISYSWDDDTHKEWVKQLATRMRANGVNVTLDRWHSAPGDQIPAFMERAVRENDFVIAVCTPQFKERWDERGSGVGYEGDIMTAYAFTSGDKKFIPVLRRGSWSEAAPTWFLGRAKIDLSGDPYSESEYEELLRTLLGAREAAPPIGGRPNFADKKGSQASPSPAPVTLLAGSSTPQHQSSVTPLEGRAGKPSVAPLPTSNPMATGLPEHIPPLRDLHPAGDVLVESSAAQSVSQRQQRSSPRKLPPLNDKFVGREKELQSIHGSLTRTLRAGVTPELVLHGQGGIGKTTSAVAYAWTHVADYPEGLFVVDCSTDNFTGAIAELSRYLFHNYNYNFTSNSNDQRNVALRVKTQLETASAPSLLILDNVADVERWNELRRSDVLPAGLCARLITTTHSHLPAAELYRLGSLTGVEAIDLLAEYRADVRLENNRSSSATIIDWVGGVPFYLTIVGIYMRRMSGLRWQDYFDSLQNTGLDAIRGAENASEGPPDHYDRHVDQVLDKLLDSLTEPERRTLEYSALMFSNEIYESALLLLLKYDPSIALQPKPGYEKSPSRYVVDELVNAQLLQPRDETSDEGARIFAMHEILKRKLIERTELSSIYKSQLLNEMYSSVTSAFIHEEPASGGPDDFLKYIAKFYRSMAMLFEGLARCGRVDNAAAHYNLWHGLHLGFPRARALAEKLGGKVLVQQTPVSTTHGRMALLVVVEVNDPNEARALAEKHGGRVVVVNPSGPRGIYNVLISIGM